VRRSERSSEFVEFTRTHREDLVRTAVLLCAGDRGLAEDLVQTTLTKLYLAWARVRRAERPLAYARAALTNVFVDESRRAHRRRETPVDELPAGVDHREPYADAELRTVVLAALAGLGPRQRAVVVLRHWHDLDVYETARALGCSVGTVKSQNARALAHLRRLLGPADDLLPVGGAR
jgi:RNA polymerase sigma-70 factor (sigma-E family)